MAVIFRLKGNKETPEYQDALALKQIIENSLIGIDIKGEILIVSNATLFGQETKDVDLVVMGSFEKYQARFISPAINYQGEELEYKPRTIFVNNFCFVIESKRHRAEDIQLSGTHLLVKYNDKLSDVTTQSENQKYSLVNFFKDRLGFAPYVCNFIWFKNINWNSIKDLLDNNEAILMKHNYLPDTFSLNFLFQLACVQSPPFNPLDSNTGLPKGYSSFNCLRKSGPFDLAHIQTLFNLFEKVKEGTGQLTRKKIEKITSQLLGTQQYAQAIGEKLVVISGRAGTGKTIKLLNIACNLAVNNGARSLILTYNHALVSDIKRILALAEIPDNVDSYTVNISTLHKFFYELLIGFGIAKNTISPDAEIKHIPDFISNYQGYLRELYEYIDSGLIEEQDIQQLMKTRHDKVAWDYILIDEAQDWGEIEKSIIFRIFGSKKTIIADGVDQLIRTQKKCNWTQRLKPEVDFKKTYEKKGLRQEVNLVSFINEYAKHMNIYWELEPKQELIGGKVIISTKGYTKVLHEQERDRCNNYGNSEYEMLFLVPPKLVNKTQVTNDYGKLIEEKRFKLANEFKEMGINIWDGTNTDLRTQYSVET